MHKETSDSEDKIALAMAIMVAFSDDDSCEKATVKVEKDSNVLAHSAECADLLTTGGAASEVCGNCHDVLA